MPLDTLRIVVGLLIILSHLTSFAMVLLYGWLEPAERMELALIISPMFGVYVSAIVRRVTMMESYDRTPTHVALAGLSIGIALIYALTVPAVILAFESGSIGNFGDLKNVIGIVETALGLYTGALVDRLFGTPKAS